LKGAPEVGGAGSAGDSSDSMGGQRGGEAVLAIDEQDRARAAGVAPADRRGRLLVEAAAGTGKTAVLVERVLNYLVSGDGTLDRMAVVTFTEMAAAELVVRLRQGLLERLRAPGDAEGAARLRRGLADLETAQVGTIHALCLELLRSRPFEAGIDPGFAVADDLTRRLLFLESWEEFLRSIGGDESGFDAAEDLGLLSEASLRQAAHALHAVEPTRLPRPSGEHGVDFARRWAALRDLGRRGAAQAPANQKLHGWFVAFNSRVDEIDRLAERERQREVLRNPLKVDLRVGRAEEVEAKRTRDALAEHVARLTADLGHERLCEVAHWLVRVAESYRRRTSAGGEGRGQLDFDQLVRGALELLRQRPDVRAEFAARFPVVLVDEFQDTDRWQVELLRLLTEDEAGEGAGAAARGEVRSFCVVGDPKQSIYRFRGADLETYGALREAWGEAAVVRLRRTFRPLPRLAEWINRVMAAAFEPAPGAPLAAYETPFHAQQAIEPTVEPGEGGVRWLELECATPESVEGVRAAEADAWARLAHRLVREGAATVRERRLGAEVLRPARFGDVALLLPKLPEVAPYEEAFARYGVPFRVLSGRGYYRREEIHALVELLRALADPGDTLAVVAALRGPACGCSDRALLAYSLAPGAHRFELGAWPTARIAASAPDPEAAREVAQGLETLRDLHRSTSGLPLPDLVAEALERSGLFVYFALQQRGDQRVANLRKAVELARRVEATGRGSLLAFVGWLEQLLDEKAEEPDSAEQDDPADEVRILTVHGAKGLEFPVVFLGGLASGQRPADSGLRVLPGAAGLELAVGSRRTTLGWKAAEEGDVVRQRAEEKRLLYVGLTRARDLLVLPREAHLALRWQSPIFSVLRGALERVGSADGASVWRAGDLPLPPMSAPSRVSVEALFAAATRAPASPESPAAPPGPIEAPRIVRPSAGVRGIAELTEAEVQALALGRAVHEVIARTLRGEPEAALAPPRKETALLAAAFLESDLARRARAAPQCLIEEVFVERGLSGALIEGQIDLAFLENGRWIVADYKTDRVARAARAAIAARAEHHAAQVALYAVALTRLTRIEVAEVHLVFLAAGETVVFTGQALAEKLARATAAFG
jgi:ATP-dependent helicase/nuclease subunit A